MSSGMKSRFSDLRSERGGDNGVRRSGPLSEEAWLAGRRAGAERRAGAGRRAGAARPFHK